MTRRRPGPGRPARVLGAGLALLAGVALALPQSGPAVAAGSCLAPPSSLAGTPDSVRHLAAGVTVRTWSGVNHRGWDVTLAVANASLARTRLVAAVPSRLGTAVPTTELLARSGGVVGVNGDFFDYDRYGAAVTNGPQVRGGGPQRVPAGWSAFVGSTADGRPVADRLAASGVVTLPPLRLPGPPRRLPIHAVNAESLPAGVTLETGYRNVFRPAADWEVVLRAGVVAWGGRRADFGPGRRFGTGRDLLLAGTGSTAAVLRTLRGGQHVAVSYRTVTSTGAVVTEAVGRGAVVLSGGRNVASCSGAGLRSRARTLVGWDRSDQIWLLTVDSGGASFPVGGPGLTYYETAELARRLGVTDAVLVDGGGSSTLAAAAGTGTVRLDAPGWTSQRPVPDGLALLPLG